NLLTSLPDYPVSVQWTLDDYQYISIDGSLKEEIPKEGIGVQLTAVLSFDQGADEAVERTRDITVTLYPPKLRNPDEIIEALEQLVDSENEISREDEALYLPDEIAGRKVSWGYRSDRKSTRLNSSHVSISYAVFCLKKKILITQI